MTQTCMCWGFDHGDGWFEIIWQLSLAIEEELAYSWMREHWYLLKKSLSRRWNRLIYTVSPITHDKRRQEGSGTTEDPYRWVVIEEAERDWLARLTSSLFSREPSCDYGSRIATLQHLGLKAFVHHPIYRFRRGPGQRKIRNASVLLPGHACYRQIHPPRRTAVGGDLRRLWETGSGE